MLFDALKLLGSMAESQSAPSAANRFGAAVQQQGPAGGAQPGGDLDGLLDGLMGRQGAAPSPGPGGQATAV